MNTVAMDCGNLFRDYQRFLDLLGDLGSGARIRREGGRVTVMWADACLCRCLPENDAVNIFLGPEARKAVRCTSYEDFVDVLQSILSRLRPALGRPQ